MIKKKALVFTPGLMVENMKEFGTKENSIAMENIYLVMVLLRLEFGKMEKDKNG